MTFREFIFWAQQYASSGDLDLDAPIVVEEWNPRRPERRGRNLAATMLATDVETKQGRLYAQAPAGGH